MPGSATPDEQLQLMGIDLASIATAAAELVGTQAGPSAGTAVGKRASIGIGL
jgi:hypothetical protein